MPKQHLPILKICSCPCQAGPNGALGAEIVEFGAVEAQKAAVAAHPQVAVPRLQDGVCLVGRQTVGLVEYRSHIGRLQLHRPRRDTAQHRQQYRQQPCSFSIHSASLPVKCSMPVCLRRGRRQGLFVPPVGLRSLPRRSCARPRRPPSPPRGRRADRTPRG